MTSNGIPVDGAIDAHAHLMPDRLMDAIREALNDAAGWEFDHPTNREAVEAVLRKHGVERYVALPYAHEPGIAADLNDWLLEEASDSEMCIPFVTVHPADDVRAVVEAAFRGGARGLKFQCPVQEVAPDDPRLDPAYELCAEYDRPVLHHAGTAPMFEDSPYVGIERFRRFRQRFPEVRACCAHMGTFEHEAFVEIARADENVYLDTSFATSPVVDRYVDFDAAAIDDAVFEDLAGRVMYGSDYPNLPHAYAREYEGLVRRDLSETAFENLFRGAAEQFLGEA
ncbi:amidohydrolase family protein [Halostella sp. JP-L12]|uniref:amidohydrolase family protein n=1 Tax=Halostella TaxID=1843185 RepID=UPI000EF7E28D|nr:MULTISPECIES: amidohydrolase family protein [Halostella]NHN49207.1 amidohydrolase family protein [Halostella sp. JP-L12]